MSTAPKLLFRRINAEEMHVITGLVSRYKLVESHPASLAVWRNGKIFVSYDTLQGGFTVCLVLVQSGDVDDDTHWLLYRGASRRSIYDKDNVIRGEMLAFRRAILYSRPMEITSKIVRVDPTVTRETVYQSNESVAQAEGLFSRESKQRIMNDPLTLTETEKSLCSSIEILRSQVAELTHENQQLTEKLSDTLEQMAILGDFVRTKEQENKTLNKQVDALAQAIGKLHSSGHVGHE